MSITPKTIDEFEAYWEDYRLIAYRPSASKKPMSANWMNGLKKDAQRNYMALAMKGELDKVPMNFPNMDREDQRMYANFLREHELRTGPADLVGALQDVVHTDPGPVRAGKVMSRGEIKAAKNQNKIKSER